jgi:hypothetical protein
VDDPALAQARQDLDGAGERPPHRQDLAEDLAVAALESLCLSLGQVAPDLARDRAGEQPTAHPDPSMDPPAVDRMAAFEQRPLPGEDMGVDGVDEGAIEVEDQGAHLASIAAKP